MVEARYILESDVKTILDDEEGSVPFRFPSSREGQRLFTDLTMAKEYPENPAPYAYAVNLLAEDFEIEATYGLLEQQKEGVKVKNSVNLVEVAGENGPTCPATGMFFATVTGGNLNWKGDGRAYLEDYEPEDYHGWIDLDLERVEPELAEIEPVGSREFTGTSFDNMDGSTVPFLEFGDARIPNTGKSQRLWKLAMESFHEALEEGEYLRGPPPSYVRNQMRNDEEIMDAPRILSEMIEESGEDLKADFENGRLDFYLGEEYVRVPEQVALTYLIESGDELLVTDSFVGREGSVTGIVDTELEPENDPISY